jgi:hypothetical protein
VSIGAQPGALPAAAIERTGAPSVHPPGDVDMASENWAEALRDLARNLINIETNTILSSGITGRKMPSYPHALQDILGKYANFMAFEVGIDVDAFCDEFRKLFGHPPLPGAASPTSSEDPDADNVDNDRQARGIQVDFTQGRFSTPLPNGPWSFYLLRWLAANALAQKSMPDHQLAIVTRIRVNSDRLRIETRDLLKLGGGNPYIDVKRDEILTMDATTKAAQPDIPPAAPEALTVIRKIWDIGTDTIVFQTVQQLDGDVIFRVRRGFDLAKQQALLEAHQQTCNVAMSYWRSMFELIAALISGLTERIFTTSGSQRGTS